VRNRIYTFYRYKIFPLVEDLRGSYRILRLLRKITSIGLEKPQSEPQSIFEAGEWDNLIILDACRHDLYEEVNGERECRISVASHTKDFIRKSFESPPYDDIVYVTGNPQLSDPILEDLLGTSEVFHEKYDVFETDWNENEKTVLPEPMARNALNARKLFPDKKVIVHMMQPHYPFVNSDLNYGGQTNCEEVVEGHEKESVWNKAGKAEIKREEVWNAHRQNLEYVMPHVKKLAENVEGRTIVTSDHGNLVGENYLYGHPRELNLKYLRKVPWDVMSE
jgi:hypothetical protein